MSFYPVTCQRCLKVIDFKDGEFLDSPTGFQVYCATCAEEVLVGNEDKKPNDQDLLEADPDFNPFLDYIDSQEDSHDQDRDISRTE